MSSTTETTLPAFGTLPRPRSRLSSLLSIARKKPLGTACFVIILIYWVMAILAPIVTKTGYNEPLYGPAFHSPSAHYWFGTDESGRDVYSRIVWAARTDLLVSLITAVVGVSGAVLVGVASGYFGGLVDMVVQRIVDTIQALPGLILLLVVVAIFGTNIVIAMAVITVLTIPVGARIIRADVLQLRQMQYVEAARAVGGGDWRIMSRHIFRGVVPTAIVLMTIALGANLLIEASLAFLGMVSSQYPDWGLMLNSGALGTMEQSPWLAVVPGLAITIIVFAYSMFGDALRDVLDPKLRGIT
jgi:peptide/nickel transport system permease protein